MIKEKIAFIKKTEKTYIFVVLLTSFIFDASGASHLIKLFISS